MKTRILIILLLFSIKLYSQDETKVVNAVKSKDFKEIKLLQDTLQRSHSNTHISITNYNDIIGNFWGCTIYFIDGESKYTSPNIRVKVICNVNQIIYYSIEDGLSLINTPSKLCSELKKIPNRYFDKIEISGLGNQYLETYKRTFSIVEFFEQHTFGVNCDTDTDEMKKLRKLIEKKQRNEILNLLLSSNTTIQVYGLYGLYKLGNLTTHELELRRLISEKKGTIEICSYDIYDTISISELINRFPSF